MAARSSDVISGDCLSENGVSFQHLDVIRYQITDFCTAHVFSGRMLVLFSAGLNVHMMISLLPVTEYA
jgi:hypothetical protein